MVKSASDDVKVEDPAGGCVFMALSFATESLEGGRPHVVTYISKDVSLGVDARARVTSCKSESVGSV